MWSHHIFTCYQKQTSMNRDQWELLSPNSPLDLDIMSAVCKFLEKKHWDRNIGHWLVIPVVHSYVLIYLSNCFKSLQLSYIVIVILISYGT
jgi:hypothetical protein